MIQRTLVLLKPDAVQRGLVGEIIGRLERRGLRLAAAKLMQVDDALARRHYSEHVGKAFFDGLVEFGLNPSGDHGLFFDDDIVDERRLGEVDDQRHGIARPVLNNVELMHTTDTGIVANV